MIELTEQEMRLVNEWIFNCDHCSGKYDINNLEIHGWPEDDPKIIVCDGCFKQLRGDERK